MHISNGCVQDFYCKYHVTRTSSKQFSISRAMKVRLL